MQLSDFKFDLPDHLIARYPAKERTGSRLLKMGEGSLSHHIFKDVVDWINEGDLLVFNDTKVIPARLFGQKMTGGKVEILIERLLDEKRALAQLRVSKAPAINDRILLEQNIELVVLNKTSQFYELCYQGEGSLLSVIEAKGHIPLPPYMQRSAEAQDKERYQTVYAKHKGSVAAPTAGFHFDESLLQRLRAKGVNMGYLTLHIGAGTFAPIRTDDITQHKMHAEYLEVTAALCEQIAVTKAAGKRVISVGTTSMRALETAAQRGELKPFAGDTTIFIYPGYVFNVVDVLITNFHLPSSTLLMLVSAFGGYEDVMEAYQVAVEEGYHFYSYGDAMWVERK